MFILKDYLLYLEQFFLLGSKIVEVNTYTSSVVRQNDVKTVRMTIYIRANNFFLKKRSEHISVVINFLGAESLFLFQYIIVISFGCKIMSPSISTI